ncbi:hypothetical protein Asi02nite_08270 [Asanoa siamensis]|uniref:Uncharacterized protein n=1 Tax=Asanoa siamensis TaxID=926357 RepID=A0ABQ4CJ36_9ACTN|nr:hypothetical protein Asi02nite_08270 [Asanoa siamensis]
MAGSVTATRTGSSHIVHSELATVDFPAAPGVSIGHWVNAGGGGGGAAGGAAPGGGPCPEPRAGPDPRPELPTTLANKASRAIRTNTIAAPSVTDLSGIARFPESSLREP